jgi:NADH-ubiquinone oxidoreductase chain 4L
MLLSVMLFLVGVIGFALNRKHLLLMLISIELMLLAVTLIVVTAGCDFNDAMGQTFGVVIIVTAGAESAIGLGMLVAYYSLRGTLEIQSQ